MKTKKQGFTLIELLVVIAIIGLLATLSLVALNSARQKSRDAKRVADIKQMQTALELYYNDNDAYPSASSALSPTYMGTVPTPPSPADGTCGTANVYTYASQDSNRSYTITYCIGAET
ncbi:prepilin-type N-terminal cleavage/methylation domain-containing protein, partial [bacterium]|nr:prepilin-type N-terminal cleavage/methylation domain-containing protein [bacterium]